MIPFIDLNAQFKQIEPQIRAAIDRILEHGQYIMGPEVFEFEKQLAQFCQVKHAISCSSGADALLMSLMAKGIGKGDAVFTTPFTFFATVEAICLTGATPVFVDIEPGVYNIDVKKLDESISKTKQDGNLTPKCIMPVDLFGQPVDYDEINQLADHHGLFVISDAAQSFGSSYKGKPVGGLSEITTTSFYPAKPLGAYGDGGAIFTNDDELASILKSIRVHGQSGEDKYVNERLGITGRLDTIQAAILIEKLAILPQEVEKRNQVAKQYHESLYDKVGLPYVKPERISAWAQYSILVPQPESLAHHLRENNVPTARFYPVPMHLQNAVSHLGYKKGDFPIAEDTATKIISLPMHPNLSESDIASVSHALTGVDLV